MLKAFWIVFNTIIAVTSVFYACTGLRNLYIFLSGKPFHVRSEIETAVDDLLWDCFLLFMFTVQHSLMALNFIKKLFIKTGLGVVQRSIYIAATTFALNNLISYWRPVTTYNLWKFDTDQTVAWIFHAVHIFAWLIIIGLCVIMDIGELFGLKQVYYDAIGRVDPMYYKSSGLQRLYSHMRHPSFTAINVILWCYPIMSLDRILLAVSLPVYMWLGFRVDSSDCYYYEWQTRMKSYSYQYNS